MDIIIFEPEAVDSFKEMIKHNFIADNCELANLISRSNRNFKVRLKPICRT